MKFLGARGSDYILRFCSGYGAVGRTESNFSDRMTVSVHFFESRKILALGAKCPRLLVPVPVVSG